MIFPEFNQSSRIIGQGMAWRLIEMATKSNQNPMVFFFQIALSHALKLMINSLIVIDKMMTAQTKSGPDMAQ